MRTALITTTIHKPEVLALYRRFADESAIESVDFYVAGDMNTPPAAKDFCKNLGYCFFIQPEDQKKWKSSELIGWNNDSRRNFALLEALRNGAELIITADDDMAPTSSFFDDFSKLFEYKFSGVQFGASGYWFDHGQFIVPPAPARGLPPGALTFNEVSSVHDVPIGIAQGSILGVPDTSAMHAIESQPFIHSISDVLRNGFVAHPDCDCVFNSQITAFRRELAPFMAQFYKYQGRNTDILASLYARRAARYAGYYTHYGLPMGFHARKPRSLMKDLENEMFGLRTIATWAQDLRSGGPLRPPGVPLELVEAWQTDCDEAMK